MATPAEMIEGISIAEIVLGVFTGGIGVNLLNSVLNRRSRSVQDGRTVVAGSVEWANALHEQNVAITKQNNEILAENREYKRRFDELEDRFNDQQDRNREHGAWDEKAAAIIREKIDPTFPDPPALEVA